MSPQDKILDKLSKMKAAAEGEAKLGNTEAAEAFASAINRLLLQHELSEADIPLSGAKDEPIVEFVFNPDTYGVKRSHVRIGGQEALARIVARAHLCRFLVHRGSNRITFIGTHAHVIVAEYAFGVLCDAASRMSNDAYVQFRKDTPPLDGQKRPETYGFRASWLTGFIERISERFDAARRAEVNAAANSSTALMRLDNALVRAQKHVDERYKSKVAAPRMSDTNAAGRVAGRRAADAMQLGQKGVSSSARKMIR